MFVRMCCRTDLERVEGVLRTFLLQTDGSTFEHRPNLQIKAACEADGIDTVDIAHESREMYCVCAQHRDAQQRLSLVKRRHLGLSELIS